MNVDQETDEMKIAVIGAAGRTGQQVVRQARDRGHEVVAVARSPQKLNVAGDRLTVKAVDVRDADSLAGAVVGADAVVTTFGAAAGREPTDLYSAGIAHVLAAMDANGIRRLAVISASPAGPRDEQPAALRLLVLPILDRFFGAGYADLRRMETALAGRSDLDWTCLRPPRVLDRSATGAYRLDPKPLPRPRSVTYPDLATALLDCADGTEPRTGTLYVANETDRGR
jgi:putative NADH-flavin reductase